MVDILPLATNIEGDQVLFRPPFPQLAHKQLLVPPTSSKMLGACSAGRFSRVGWKRGQFFPNQEVRRGEWSTVLWVFAQKRERPVVNASFQLAQGGPEFVETKQASSEYPPLQELFKWCISTECTHRPTPRLPTKSERMNASAFRGSSPGYKAAERGEKTRGRHVDNDLNVHCASYHAGE
ncbi:hypothetical protein T12_16712 [Trichinella patagoniensis]|uniref:Uncharacterized protein n=1 Tax=Trichinella patagoniensis TaxID=990121 RepID=A0A0V0ZWK0_9BILA|nr:hypothetical protein T12_16712 [Trichinella patagoniensis]